MDALNNIIYKKTTQVVDKYGSEEVVREFWNRTDKDVEYSNSTMSKSLISYLNYNDVELIIDKSIRFKNEYRREFESCNDFSEKNHIMLAICKANVIEVLKKSKLVILKKIKYE